MIRCCGMAKRQQTEPWEHSAPKKASHTKLSPAKKAAAKRRAKRAGRHYPNLVDNMYEAAQKKTSKK
jgi:ribosomal protein L15E